MAKLVPISNELEPRHLGSMRGKISTSDDFDQPLPPEVLARFLGGDQQFQRDGAPNIGR
jgi:hypothetical protein